MRKKFLLILLGLLCVSLLGYKVNSRVNQESDNKDPIEAGGVQSGSRFLNWTYRKIHNITGSTAGAQDYYQMKFTMHFGSSNDTGEHFYLDSLCQEDFDDIRFTWYNNSDGNEVECDYWLEKKVDNDYAIFWAEIIYIPAYPENATINIYYGNPEAASESNGDETFLFWDDFETDLSKWTIRNGTAIELPQLSGNYSYQGNLALEIQRKGNSVGINLTTTTNTAVRVYFYDQISDKWESQCMSGRGTPGIETGLIGVAEGQSSTRYVYRIGGTYYVSSVVRTVGWHLFEITNYDFTKKFWIDGHHQQVTDNSSINNFALGSWWVVNDEYGYFDVAIQRKFVFPEPTHGVPCARLTWEYAFTDRCRGTMLRISTDDKHFQFITPNKEYPIKYDPNMRICQRRCSTSIEVCYVDDEIKLSAKAIDGRVYFCIACAIDQQTCKKYLLIDSWRRPCSYTRVHWKRCFTSIKIRYADDEIELSAKAKFGRFSFYRVYAKDIQAGRRYLLKGKWKDQRIYFPNKNKP